MFGLGTIVNTGAIIAGGILGLFAGRLLNEKVQKALLAANGICVLFIGMQAALNGMNETDAGMMVIVSFALGTLIGKRWIWKENWNSLAAG